MQSHQTRYPLMFANIELTLKCNMRCLHCGSTAGKSRARELSLEMWLQVMSQLAGLGCKEVCLLDPSTVVADMSACQLAMHQVDARAGTDCGTLHQHP